MPLVSLPLEEGPAKSYKKHIINKTPTSCTAKCICSLSPENIKLDSISDVAKVTGTRARPRGSLHLPGTYAKPEFSIVGHAEKYMGPPGKCHVFPGQKDYLNDQDYACWSRYNAH